MNAIRTTHKTYEFTHPFSLGGYTHSFLPGRYSIETEQELSSESRSLDSRWFKSRLYFTPKSGAPIELGLCDIDPDDFDRAILLDGERHFGVDYAKDSVLKMPRFDRFAIECGENEGMRTQ